MKLREISPRLYKLYYFKHLYREEKHGKISFEKTQYVYRLLFADKGSLDVCIGGKTQPLKAGDVLFLVPGAVYRLLPCESDFSLYNLSFAFTDAPYDGRESCVGCVFLSDYDRNLCVPKVDFEDAPCLNESKIFKNVLCNKAFEDLVSASSVGEIYPFFASAKIKSLLADMLFSEVKEGEKNSAVSEILSYIRLNPTKNLSGDELSKRFSYHKNHINKLIKRATGKSVSEYIRHVKIEYAAILLSEGGTPTEIAVELGYYDYSHFYKAFVAETGVSPTQYGRKRS